MIAECIKDIDVEQLNLKVGQKIDVGYSVNESLYNIYDFNNLLTRLEDKVFNEYFIIISYMACRKKLEKYGDYKHNPNILLICE